MFTFQEASALLAKARNGSKKVDNNTYLMRNSDGTPAVRLHQTDVVTINPDGTYTLTSGGWRTVTTKARINVYSPARLSQRNGDWLLTVPGGATVPFHNGIKVRADGSVVE